MRKILQLAVFLLVLQIARAQPDNPLERIAKEYFRANPFQQSFSGFLAQLMNDPGITGKIIERKTDTSLFYFEGNYTHHNPFFFKPQSVKVILTEIVIPVDSLPPDTIFAYQLIAKEKQPASGTDDVRKEFDRIFRHVKSHFSHYTEGPNPVESTTGGKLINFFDRFHAVAPFGISWYGPDEENDIGLVLSIRMDVRNNAAILPVPFVELTFDER